MNRIIIICIIKIVVFGVKAISIHFWTCFTCGLSLWNHLSCPCCTKNWPRVLHVLRKNFPAARCRLSDTGLRSRGAYGVKWLGNNFTGHVVRKKTSLQFFLHRLEHIGNVLGSRLWDNWCPSYKLKLCHPSVGTVFYLGCVKLDMPQAGHAGCFCIWPSSDEARTAKTMADKSEQLMLEAVRVTLPFFSSLSLSLSLFVSRHIQ